MLLYQDNNTISHYLHITVHEKEEKYIFMGICTFMSIFCQVCNFTHT